MSASVALKRVLQMWKEKNVSLLFHCQVVEKAPRQLNNSMRGIKVLAITVLNSKVVHPC